jgi:hypothetical protein
MKVVVLYRPNSEHERSVLTFQRDFHTRTGKEVSLMSLDTVEGDQLARIYDITSYPGVLVTTDEGKLIQLWQGENLPLINDVSGFALLH